MKLSTALSIASAVLGLFATLMTNKEQNDEIQMRVKEELSKTEQIEEEN
ncbi:MAG: hypothetical protein KBT27_09400 [Prevotellaceae bacterium]|nr:hypothetical protein [Candidatus Faecinaster equi]